MSDVQAWQVVAAIHGIGWVAFVILYALRGRLLDDSLRKWGDDLREQRDANAKSVERMDAIVLAMAKLRDEEAARLGCGNPGCFCGELLAGKAAKER